MKIKNKFAFILHAHYAIIATGTITVLCIHLTGGNIKHIAPYSLFCFVLIAVVSALICTVVFYKMRKL